MMVSLTLMLVIATISASIHQTLPATPYYKMIDVWLFFSMNLMVYSITFHTFLEQMIKKEEANEGKGEDQRYWTLINELHLNAGYRKLSF